jgi:hypothetical protein
MKTRLLWPKSRRLRIMDWKHTLGYAFVCIQLLCDMLRQTYWYTDKCLGLLTNPRKAQCMITKNWQCWNS